jgi:endonuclease-3
MPSAPPPTHSRKPARVARSRGAKTSLRITRTLKKRAVEILDLLDELYPQAGTELDYGNHFELLIAVILSAQCTDVRVNMVTPALFTAFPDAEALALVEAEEVEPYIKTCGLFRSKARNLVKCSRDLVSLHGGNVPSGREELEALAGVGRKTANVVLSNAFETDAIAVDTHVFRLSRLMGLSKANGAEAVERDLMAILPQDRWNKAHHTLIWHGRRCCKARKPECPRCPVAHLCPGEESYPDDISEAMLSAAETVSTT